MANLYAIAFLSIFIICTSQIDGGFLNQKTGLFSFLVLAIISAYLRIKQLFWRFIDKEFVNIVMIFSFAMVTVLSINIFTSW